MDFLLSETYTVAQAVDTFGFGKFQVKLSLFTGLCWMADSMETTILSILSPTLHYEWQISRFQQALATTVCIYTINVKNITHSSIFIVLFQFSVFLLQNSLCIK